MEHLYPTRDSIVKELSTIPELTVYNLRKRLNRPKKEIVFVLDIMINSSVKDSVLLQMDVTNIIFGV